MPTLRIPLAWKIGLLLLLPLTASLAAVGFFASYLRATRDDVRFVNAAGRQRMLSAELSSWAQRVSAGQEEARRGLRLKTEEFEASLATLRRGGRVLDFSVGPVSSDIHPYLDGVAELWRELRPDLDFVAAEPRTSPRFREAYRRIEPRVEGLKDRSNLVLTAFAARNGRLMRRMRDILAAVAGFMGLFFVVGFALSMRAIVLPILRLDEAVRRIGGGVVSPGFDGAGQDELPAIVKTFHAMASRVGRLLDALDLRRRHAETIIANMPAGIVVLRGDLTVLRTNPGFREAFGIGENAAAGRPLEDVLPAAGLREAVLEVLATGRAKRALRLEAAGGGGVRRPLRVTVAGTHLAEEGEDRVLVVVEDVSDEERLKGRAQAADDRYYAVLENATDAIVLMDRGGRIAYFNRAAERMFGYERVQALGEPLTMLMPEKYREAHLRGLARYAQTGRFSARGPLISAEGLRKDGATFPVEISVGAHGAGAETIFTGILRDVGEKVRSQERIRLQSAAMDAIAEPVVITDLRGAILTVNAAFIRQTGWSAEEAVGQNPRMLKSGLTDEKIYPGMWRAILAGKAWTGDVINRRKDGSVYVAELSIVPIRDAEGAVCRFVSTQRDITESRRMQEALREQEAQLRQAQKMEAVGRLAGGVAHDFNNLLTAILGCGAFLLQNLKPDDPNRTDVLEIEAAGGRAAALTKQLLAFSRKQMLQPKDMDLNAAVNEMQGMLRRLIGEDIELRVLPHEKPLVVLADRGQIEQVVMNLALNARDAIPNVGKIIIETAPAEFDEAHLHRHGAVPPGAYAVLAVSDTGCGMSEAVQSHLFEPFFTTKASGKGTGLGLSTVYGIVTQSGGYITAYSEAGRGTTFKIYLPRSRGQAEKRDSAAARAELPKGSGTVLLVEDEASVRELARRALTLNGFTVIAVADPLEALALCERHKEPIRLLVTDMVMPKLSGLEVARKVRAARPGIAVLYMSGYTEHAVFELGLEELEGAFLQKPFVPRGLLEKVHEVLGARP